MKRSLVTTVRLTLVALVLSLGFSSAVSAQEITGTISGTVKDANGGAVSGATVTLTDVGTRLVVRTVSTGEDGSFSAPLVPAGEYIVTVEAPSFKKTVQTDVKLDANQARTLAVTLEAGSIAEVVTVAADPVAVQLTTPATSTVINGDQVRELSLNNRNWVQLVALAPGVSNDLADQVYVGTTNPAGQANTMNIAVNGARSAQNTYRVDAADITDRGSNITIQGYPSVDSIAEFSISRSLYPAAEGGSGGGQVNVVTRSGGEKFHGSVFEFVRNEILNANDFLSNSVTNPAFGRDDNGKAKRTPFRYNNFGGTISGPVYLPRFGEGGDSVIRLKRTFFFFSEEQRRDIRYPLLSSTVPDLNMRQGIFPIDICLRANAPTTATATCLDILPAGTPLASRASINPVAQQYLTFIYNKLPPPTTALTRALLFPAKNISDFRQEIIKLDHAFTDTWSVYYRYQNDKIPTIDANSLFSSGSGLPGVATTSTNSPGKTHTFQSTHVLSPKFIVVGRFAYGYGAILSENIGTLALVNSPITPPLAYTNQRDRVPTVTGNGFSNLQSFGPYDNFSYKRNYSGDVTWIRGSHALKFGAIYGQYRKNENALAGSNEGTYSGFLNTLLTSPQQLSVLAPQVAGQDNNAARRTNFQAFANFLQGNNVTFSQAHFDYTADLRQTAFEAYGQDEWRFRPNLSLYYGMRYSYFGSPYDKNGRLSNFDPSLFSAASAPRVTGAGNRVIGTGNFCNGMIVNSQNYQTAANNCTPISSPYGDRVVNAPKDNFAPRVGLAWDPFGKGRTSVRAGYGIFYDQVLNGTYLQNIGNNPPYQETFTISQTRLDQPVPTGVTVTAGASVAAPNIRAIQPNWEDPYMQQWSLDLQHQIGNETLFTVGYFGSKGTHLIGAYEINELPPGFAISRGPTGCAVLASTTPTAPCQVAGTGFFTAAATNILDQLRPFQGYRGINMITPQFNSNYHSLQVSGQRRFSGASQVNLAYTWSKNMTDSPNDRTNAPQNSYDIRSEYQRAALDRRHVLSLNYIYELPFFKTQQGFTGKLLGGWQASGIIVYNTGLPFSAVTSLFDASGLGTIPVLNAGNRPNVLCDPNANAPHTAQQFFNTGCFQLNPAANATNIVNAPGNAGRGTIDGPSTKRVDFTMTKNIRFGESVQLQLRGEAFNIFNTTNFRTIIVNVTAANYGQVTAVRDPRTIQLGAKLSF
ncbi:MAG: carboxypeptidase regulatory-like domain-containing protein [Pyrinomonadaceae bacterium]|nr:carboxypeptidase regulatory-like domain-containing protein [Pyrinomonadaceae bacterium]